MVKHIELTHNSEIYNIIVGENAQENWDIISDADSLDIWFHLENNPSPHVILKTNKTKLADIDKKIIFLCGAECKNRSKLKSVKNTYVIYTEIKNVSKAEDIGSVYTKKTKRVCIG